MSNEQKQYLKNIKKQNIKIIFTQILIFILFITLWQILAKQIFITIKNLYIQNNLFPHILITIKETIISFILTSILSIIISIMLYNHNFIAKVLDPYLTILNSLPKVALGPIIIIWIGANTKSIILMAILISLIVSIQTIYNGFINTDKLKIKLLKTFNASKKDILINVVLKENKSTILNSFKINISMCLIGVIMGEFLTSKTGIGYLILYGSQVFNLNLVMSGIFILTIISIVMYKLISKNTDK